jgi:outer membrane protein TolC
MAGYRGAKAAVRATSAGLDSQLNDTLSGILQAYADLYEAQTTVEYQARAVAALKSIAARAEERLTGGQGTTVAVGQARAAELDAERTFNQGCRDVYDKSQALAQSFGLQLTPGHIIKTLGQVPVADQSDLVESDLDAVVESDPAVISAKEQITAAEDKLGQARAQFGPTLSLTARRDYLGQSPDGFGDANRMWIPLPRRIVLRAGNFKGPCGRRTLPTLCLRCCIYPWRQGNGAANPRGTRRTLVVDSEAVGDDGGARQVRQSWRIPIAWCRHIS